MIRPIYSHHETIGGETVRVLEGYEADEATKAAATIVYGTKPDTYRELLELAAKAAGYVIEEHARNGSAWAWVHPVGSTPDADGDMPSFKWNPRNDDGDALRLAVKLNLQINPTISTYFGPASTAYDGGVGISTIQHGGDPSLATRLAIVRAAAEVGRAMP